MMTSTLALLTRFVWDSSGAVRLILDDLIGGHSVTINPLRAQDALVAPYQVTLEAEVTDFGVTAGGAGEWDPQYHDIEYIWSVEKVGDASYATSTYSAPVHVPAANRVKGTKYGKRIVHVIGRDDVSAGSSSTFRFVCTAVNLATGISATSAAYERVIEHPDDYFSAAETFVVRASGSSETGYPTTSNSLYTTPSAAKTAVTAAAGAKARICIQNGLTSTGDTFRGPSDTAGATYLIDTWGAAPAKPAINDSPRWEPLRDMQSNYTTVCIYGVRRTSGSESYVISNYSIDCVTIDSVDTEGMGDALGFSNLGDMTQMWIAYSNCAGDGFTLTGGLVGGKIRAAVGSRIAHVPEQSSDQKAGGGYGVRSITGTELVYISQCDFFIRQGWFNNSPGISTTQPAIRLFGASAGNSIDRGGRYIHVERNTFEAISVSLGDESTSQIMNVLADRNVCLGVHDNFRGLMNFGSSATVRNNLFIFPPSRNAQNNSNFAPGRAVQFVYAAGLSDPRSDPGKVYNNTLIYLGNGTAPVMVDAGAFSITEANNVVHAPYASTPSSAGSFSLSEIFTPRYDGYDERRGSPGDAYYIVKPASVSSAFTAGETVTGGTSGTVKTFVDVYDRFQSTGWLRFEMSVVDDNLNDATGFAGFTAGETITGNLGGSAVLDTGGNLGQVFEYDLDAQSLIPRTITPTHYIDYDGKTGAFTEGNTLTNGTATALICQVWDDGTTGRLWLRDVSGTFSNDQPLTDGSGGAATANGGQQSAGTGALWTLNGGDRSRDGANWSTFPFTRRNLLGATTTLRGALAS